ncbi:MAG TPA: type II toxin-antitoxin system VapC family toxin [Rhizomicrobium sp.]|nr:type II toxin-antitoxin system VapC family toxin [Rhizomicrobium sp.]
MLLLDTCVVSEGVKPAPDPAVIRWMKFQDPMRLFISAVTLGELHFGAAQVSSAAKQRAFVTWVGEVEQRFADRIVVLDDVVARQWGHLRAVHPAAPTADAQIAATALAYGFVFATRNVKHFMFDGLSVVNPWEH